MKYLILLPFAVLIGLAVGSWAPKRDLVKIRKEMNELQKELDKRDQGGKLSALNSIIKIPEKKSKAKSRPHGFKDEATEMEAPMEEAGVETNLTDLASSTNSPASTRKKRERRFPDPKSESYEADMEEAKELWATRVEMARAQWQAKLKLNDAELVRFDEAIADMNDKLHLTMQAVAEELQQTDKMSTETGIRIMNEVSSTLVETYDQIGEIVPAGQRPLVEGIEMQDLIDPAVADPLIKVRNKL